MFLSIQNAKRKRRSRGKWAECDTSWKQVLCNDVETGRVYERVSRRTREAETSPDKEPETLLDCIYSEIQTFYTVTHEGGFLFCIQVPKSFTTPTGLNMERTLVRSPC